MVFDPKYIRNFSIVAHIDHGKSTLADQLLLQSGAITQREFREQLLDDMDLERERGITIKARAVAINYVLDGQNYELNLIDTPGDPKAPLRALIFDSKFDDYQGVITYVRVVDGTLRVGQPIRLMAGETVHEVTGLGRFRPREVACDELGVGQVGYVIANIKRLSDVRIGDTITDARVSALQALAGYQEPKQVV